MAERFRPNSGGTRTVDAFASLPFNAVHVAMGALAAVTLFRLWFITRLQLVPDEAYYWLWSKDLAASYRDKGPAVAWTIALGTKLFGDTAFGIRFFAVLFASGTSWLVFSLARRLFDDRTALWCLTLITFVPLFAAEAILMTIDPISIFAWAWAMAVFWNALQSRELWRWVILGFAIGVGFLAKFTNGVQLVCIGLFLLWSRDHRRLLISRQTILMSVAFCATISPLVYWNMKNGWIHVAALHSRSGVEDSFGFHPAEFFQFVGGQFLVLSPLMGLGLLMATIGLARKQHNDIRIRFLLTQLVPLVGIFLFFSLNKSGKENWTAPALLSGVVLLVVFWRNLTARSPKWRWAVYPAVAMALVMTGFAHDTDLLRLPPLLDPLRTAQGWDDFAAHVQRAREKYGTSLLIGHRYQEASVMSYYLPDKPRTYLPPERYGKSQFSLWPGYVASTNALFVSITLHERPLPPALLRDFPKCQLVDDFWSRHHGRPMTRFRIYFCTRE